VVNRPSMQTSSLTASAPARRRSVHRLGQEVNRWPRTTSASIRVHGLWQMAAIGLPVPANSLTKLDRIPVDAQQVGGPPGFPDRYDVGVVALSDDLHIFARFGEPVPEHGAPVTVTTGFLRTEADRPVYGPVFAPGGGPASRQAGEARRGPATAGPAGLGVTLPALYALVGDAYQTRYGTLPDAFAEVVVRSRQAAAANPGATAASRSPGSRSSPPGPSPTRFSPGPGPSGYGGPAPWRAVAGIWEAGLARADPRPHGDANSPDG
jgi:hypothetical protein